MTDEEITVTIKESWLKDMVDAHNKRSKLEAENQQLKELLKECRVYVENCEQFNQYDLDMLGKIDNVIGENKCIK